MAQGGRTRTNAAKRAQLRICAEARRKYESRSRP
jgi:hypothetical protein